MNEEAMQFGASRSLVGIFTEPGSATVGSKPPTIILSNAGLVHRVGPNRIYVRMARKFAEMGFPVFRFDFSGIGDSEVRRDNLPFEESRHRELQDAMNLLVDTKGINKFILMGICSGAVASFKTACQDPRVVALAQINPQGYDAAQVSYAKGRNLWRGILSNPASSLKQGVSKYKTWGKADYLKLVAQLGGGLTGKSKVVASAHQVTDGFRRLEQRGVHHLLVYSAGDPGLDYREVILEHESDQLRSSGRLRVEVIQQADHLFTPLKSQEDLLRVVQDWAQDMAQPELEIISTRP